MKRQTKLTTEQQQQHTAEQQAQAQAQTAHEFASVEEMLRHDAIHTPVPPSIEQRLIKSAAELPQQKSAWWKRFLGGNS